MSRIDTRTGKRVAADIRVDAGPAALAVTATDVWVATRAGKRSRESPARPQVKRIEVEDGPSSVAVGDQVWVTNRDSGTVSRIDNAHQRVVPSTSRARQPPSSVDGELWAAAGAYPSAAHRGGTLV